MKTQLIHMVQLVLLQQLAQFDLCQLYQLLTVGNLTQLFGTVG